MQMNKVNQLILGMSILLFDDKMKIIYPIPKIIKLKFLSSALFENSPIKSKQVGRIKKR